MAHGELLIEVAVEDLLKTLQRNKTKHVKEYEQAKKGYYKLLRRELDTKLDVLDARDNGTLQGKVKGVAKEKDLARIVNQKPQTYVDFYDQAIEMLEYASNETVQLDTQQFQEYVKDEWNWKATFTTSNTAYAAAVRRR